MRYSGLLETSPFRNFRHVERVVDTKGGADFLGSPLWGSEDFFNTSLSTRIDKIWESQQRLQDIEDPQVELLLLRSCLSLCKLNRILRTVPPDESLANFNLLTSIYGRLWNQ